MRKFLRQDRDSDKPFDSVYEHYKQRVWHYLRGRGIPENDAEDVYHDIALAVSQYLILKEPENMDKLIFGIARKKAADYFRRIPHQFVSVGLKEADHEDL